MKNHKLTRKTIGTGIAALFSLAGGFLIYTIYRSWPQETGYIKLPGLRDKVEVLRDSWGIPHIYASNQHDLFMAQGYVHAQDRFWQMDVWRHIGSGRLSEMFGKTQLKTDQFLRTLGWSRIAQKELAQSDPNAVAILQAYSAGVNAYLADHHGSALSLEYAVLKFLSPNYQPEPWQPIHTLTWTKVMAWDLSSGNINSEIQRAILLKTLKPKQENELFPLYPVSHPVIVPKFSSATVEINRVVHAKDSHVAATFSSLQAINKQLTALNMLGPTGEGIGSNSWVISGQRTATGKPILANDPHLGVQMPSIWYEVGLHCTSKGSDCPYQLNGFSFPGVPGVVIGHNNHIAWGFTNVESDVADLYIEKINPHNPNQYEVNGQWVNMQLITENVQVAGDKSVSLTVRYTRHGPIISDTYDPLVALSKKAGIGFPTHYAIALRWTALEPSRTFRAIWKINRAQNWSEFRTAASDFNVPGQNLVYADSKNNIGYQMTGNVPIRTKGKGEYPIPGWLNEYEWKKYVPFEQLPFAFNPPQGYIVTANNAVVGSGYPYLISNVWDYGDRAKRIVEMIEGHKGRITLNDFKQMQGDNKNLNAETLVPILLRLPLHDARLRNARSLLKNWDFQQHMDGAAPALFETFWRHLLADTFHDKLPKEYWPNGNSRWVEVVRNLVKQSNSPWWDNKTTPVIETRDQIFQQAFAEAVEELDQNLGKDPKNWRWGDLHTITFRNTTLGKSGISLIEALFNRGPFPISGGSSIVNATAWNASKSFEAYWSPSMRMIVDLSNLQNSLAILTTGQSGHAFHRHYDDMVDSWRKIQYHPMWDQRTVEAGTSTRLTLAPSSRCAPIRNY